MTDMAWGDVRDPEPWCEAAGQRMPVTASRAINCPGCGARIRLRRDWRVPPHQALVGVPA